MTSVVLDIWRIIVITTSYMPEMGNGEEYS